MTARCSRSLAGLEHHRHPRFVQWRFNGANPECGVVLDGQGNLYGTTALGGADNDGTVFEIVTRSNIITDLASFNGANGAIPFSDVVLDGQGNLYGTTYEGGVYGDGTVFELAKRSNTITTLASFNGANGANRRP